MTRSIRRLAFVTDAPHFGGAERYVISMAHAARRHGLVPHVYWCPTAEAEADVFTRAGSDDASSPHVPATPDRATLAITTAPADDTVSWLGLARSFRSMLRNFRPDALVINACGRPRFWTLTWLARQAGIPTAWVQHMVDGRDHRSLPPARFGGRMEGPGWWRVPQWWRHQLACLAASAVISSNETDHASITRTIRGCRDKARIVPPGVDTESFRFDPAARIAWRHAWGISNDHPDAPYVVGTAGRLVAGKRIDLLIEAVSRLRAARIPITAVIAGDGRELATLMDRARQLGVSEHVHFAGRVDEMAGFYSALDAFVLCSETESFGLVIAEAMACERAVVATPTAGAGVLIQPGANGLLCRDHSVADLADALRTLFENPARRELMGRSGRQRVVEHFSIDRTLDSLLSILQKAVPNRDPRGAPGFHRIPAWPVAEDPR